TSVRGACAGSNRQEVAGRAARGRSVSRESAERLRLSPAMPASGEGCSLRGDRPATRGKGDGTLGCVYQTAAHWGRLERAEGRGWNQGADAISAGDRQHSFHNLNPRTD